MNNEILMCGTEPIGQLYKDTKAEATSIAPIEVSPTEASHNIGTHIMYGGIRYKVTSNISVGDTLTIGENIVAENIESNIVYSNGTSVKDKIDEINGATRITGNSAYFSGSALPYMYYKRIGNVVVGGARFVITTEKPSGQSNFLFEGLPVPAGSIIPVMVSVGDNASMLINNQGHLTSNDAVSGTHNTSFCYICQ